MSRLPARVSVTASTRRRPAWKRSTRSSPASRSSAIAVRARCLDRNEPARSAPSTTPNVPVVLRASTLSAARRCRPQRGGSASATPDPAGRDGHENLAGAVRALCAGLRHARRHVAPSRLSVVRGLRLTRPKNAWPGRAVPRVGIEIADHTRPSCWSRRRFAQFVVEGRTAAGLALQQPQLPADVAQAQTARQPVQHHEQVEPQGQAAGGDHRPVPCRDRVAVGRQVAEFLQGQPRDHPPESTGTGRTPLSPSLSPRSGRCGSR